MRLIDADELVARLRNDPLFGLVEQYGITGVIEAQPTVDAVPVRHGEWIIEDGHVCCSECGEISKEYNWCPYCGARMDEE